MIAKARVQEIESRQEEIEKKYISDKGIVNPDGSTPDFLWCMDDDAAFEKANEECSALIVAAGLESALNPRRSESRGRLLDFLRPVSCSLRCPGDARTGREAERGNPAKGDRRNVPAGRVHGPGLKETRGRRLPPPALQKRRFHDVV